MRNILILVLVLCGGCATVTDGPFRQTEGRPIDYDEVDALHEEVATISDAVAALGKPSSRSINPDGTEVIEYISVRRRESKERIFGIVRDQTSQTMRERVLLSFRDGKLVAKEKSYEVD